jgi:AsmA protein
MIRKKLLKVLKWTTLGLVFLLALMFLLPILFPGPVTRQIKQWTNESIEGKLDFRKSRLSFFHHFPSLTLTLYDYSLLGSRPFEKDTLAAGKELSFGIDVLSLFRSSIRVNKFFLEQSTINILTDADGNANYNIYKGIGGTESTADSSSGAGLRLEGVFIRNSRLLYRDQSLPMTIEAEGLNYSGKGNLQDAEFDLQSKLNIGSFSLEYDGTPYVRRKPLNAELVTSINTSSLVFRFGKNDVMLKKLPVDFTGKMAILKDGYDIDLRIISGVTDFANIFSVLPPEYDNWVANMQFTGTSRATLAMQGSYRAATGQQPNLSATLRVQNGSFKHSAAPVPLKNLNFSAAFDMPALDIEQIALRVDSLGFDVNGEQTNAALLYKGYSKPYIKAKLQSRLNLELLNQAMALPDIAVKGKLAADVAADGPFDYNGGKLPKTKAEIDWTDGLLKIPYYPNPFWKIFLKANVQCVAGTPADAAISLQPVSFVFEEMPFAATAQVKNLNSPVYDVTAKGTLNLTHIYQVFAVKDVNVTGTVVSDVALKGAVADAETGRYDRLDNQGTLAFNKLKFQTSLYPHPFEIPEGSIRLNKDKAYVKDLQLAYAQNRFTLNGTASGFIAYYLGKGNFIGDVQVQSPRLVVDDFMAYQLPAADSAAHSTTATSGVVMLPGKMKLSLGAAISEVEYAGTKLRDFNGSLLLNDGKLQLEQTSFSLAGARMAMQGSYKPTKPNSALFDAAIKADSFDVARAYKEIPIFREMASAAEYAKGLVSVDYTLAGRLNAQMAPVYPSIKGGGTLKLEDVQLKGYKLFGVVSKATGKDSLNNPRLKAVVVKTSIANNIITIERTKMKVLGFRPRIEGQASLDGKLNLRFRLGLPPFGVIGIPMTVTGTSDNPIVKMRKGNEQDMLAEEEDKEGREQ